MLNEVDPAVNRSLANGSATSFAYTFEIADRTHIEVLSNLTVQVLDVDYTVDGVGNSGGGNVIFYVPPANLKLITRLRKQPASQLSAYNPHAQFPATQVGLDLDKLVMQIQQIRELLHRGFFLPKNSQLVDQGIAEPVEGAFARGKTGGGIDWATPTLASPASLPISIANGGTGQITAALARAALSAITGSGEVLTNCTASADPTVPLGLATKQYVDSFVSIGTLASYNANTTIAAAVRLALLSGASFTLTLGAVAANAGRTVTIKHQGTSLTQVYTIQGNGAENIIADDGTANTYLLYTAGEEITLFCNGVAWYVLQHLAKTEWVDAGVMTITGSGANPTKPTTPDLDKVYWRRQGTQMFLRYILQISSAAGSAAGTGGYLFDLPTGLAFDTTVVSPVGSSMIVSIMSEAVRSALHGVATFAIDSVAIDGAKLYAVNTTRFQAVRDTTFAVIGSGTYPLTNAEMAYYMEFQARAANWRL